MKGPNELPNYTQMLSVKSGTLLQDLVLQSYAVFYKPLLLLDHTQRHSDESNVLWGTLEGTH